MLWKGLAAWVWDNPWIKLQQERAEHERESLGPNDADG